MAKGKSKPQGKGRKTEAQVRRRPAHRLPGEYEKTSLVKLPMDTFELSVYAPERLTEDVERRAKLGDTVTTVHYIVHTKRLDKTWTFEVEIDGNVIRLPAKVVDKMIDHRRRILAEAAADRATERAQQQRAVREQSEAKNGDPMEAEPMDDLDTDPLFLALSQN